MNENKKIKNAHPKEYNGIKFKSQLEVMTYKTLIEQSFIPKYEEETYILWDGFIPSVPFYTKNSFKRKNHNIEVLSPFTVKDQRPPTNITYTPDFTFDYKDRHIIIECKGMVNDVFPYKFKMFRKSLEQLPNKNSIEVWEIYSKKQLLECIEYLKQDTNGNTEKIK